MRGRKTGRTQRTFNNKLTRLKGRYKRLSKGEKFKAKYPTFESFLAVHTIKQVGGVREESTVKTYTTPKRSIWGN